MNRRGFGTEGEYDVHDYLVGQGYQVLEMNYRRGPGEIDLIARQGRTIVFIEVKRRTTDRYGRPAQAVTPAKRRRIVYTAVCYVRERGLTDVPLRFDVVEVTPGRINHIVSAFDATGLL